MSTSKWMVLAVALVLTAIALAQDPNAARERFNYRDDHDGRRLADVRLQVVERGGARSLEMTISAQGPLVEPMPGFAGIRGGNRHTAEQLDNIAMGRIEFAVKTRRDGAAEGQGTWRVGRHGPILERRLRPDGHIDYWSPTPRDYPLELIVDTGKLVDGRHTMELWFDGIARLRIRYDVAGDRVRPLAFASLPGADAPVADEPNQKKLDEAPIKLPLTDAEWDARDLEGKWVLFRKIAGDDDQMAKAFAPYLARRKDFDFLEMMALHQPLYEGALHAAWALAKADAPQWLRVAARLRMIEADHGEGETGKILLKHNPAKALAWLQKYAESKDPARLPLPVRDLAKLRAQKIVPGAIEGALPPLTADAVFRHLDAPKDVVDFGDRLRVEAGQVYLHQVARTLKTFAHFDDFREPWLGKTLALTRHTHPSVRQQAYLAFADFATSLDPKSNPIDEFARVVDDPKESRAIREAATMAFAAFDHPRVYVRLHELALEAEHPAWKAALSQLLNCGNEFTLAHLIRVDSAKLSTADNDHLAKVHATLREWQEQPGRNTDLSVEALQTLLERSAWAELTKSRVASTLAAWTKNHVAEPRFADRLGVIRDKYVPRHAVSDDALLTRMVRDRAREIGNGLKR
jgi:hypothetical protein